MEALLLYCYLILHHFLKKKTSSLQIPSPCYTCRASYFCPFFILSMLLFFSISPATPLTALLFFRHISPLNLKKNLFLWLHFVHNLDLTPVRSSYRPFGLRCLCHLSVSGVHQSIISLLLSPLHQSHSLVLLLSSLWSLLLRRPGRWKSFHNSAFVAHPSLEKEAAERQTFEEAILCKNKMYLGREEKLQEIILIIHFLQHGLNCNVSFQNIHFGISTFCFFLFAKRFKLNNDISTELVKLLWRVKGVTKRRRESRKRRIRCFTSEGFNMSGCRCVFPSLHVQPAAQFDTVLPCC